MSDKKYALVTGASRGIGKACALELSAQGYHILINYSSRRDAAEAVLQEITAAGGSGELLPFNVADLAQVKETLGGWMEANADKPIEVLVNNAGIKDDTLLVWMKDEQWENVIDINLNGFFYITRLVVSQMVRQRYGRIINIVSLSGIKGMTGQVNYSAAKSGVIGATKALAQEVAKRNITVNAVAPGFIATDMTGELNEEELKRHIPAGRFGQPEEVAHAVGFLASKNAAYINGIVLSINGALYT